MKKCFRKKSLYFALKKFCEKSPFNKKSPDIKSYHYTRLYFLGLFFCLQYDFIQKRPRKKNKECLHPCKMEQMILNNTRMTLFKVQMRKKSLSYENVLYLNSFSQDLGLFSSFFFFGYIFLRTVFPVILFPETLTAPILFSQGVPGVQNTGLYFR